MSLENYILFFFSALGVFNGLVLTIYFLVIAKPWHISNGFFASLLLVLCIRIGKSLFFYFNPDLANTYIQLGISACFFIGPLLYFYSLSIFKSNSLVFKYWKFHLTLLALIICIAGFYFPYRQHLALWKNYFMYIVYVQWFIYMLLTAFIIFPIIRKKWLQNDQIPTIDSWVINVFLGTLAVFAAYVTGFYTSYIVGALSFSVITYLLLLFFIFNKNKKSVLYLSSLKLEKRKIPNERASELLTKLKQLMDDEKVYLNPNLKLEDLAERLGMSVHGLSSLLNDTMGNRFTEMVNNHRIEFAKQLMLSNKNLTLEAIGYESGFNSKSTFYNSFKKSVGVTPAMYLKQL